MIAYIANLFQHIVYPVKYAYDFVVIGLVLVNFSSWMHVGILSIFYMVTSLASDAELWCFLWSAPV